MTKSCRSNLKIYLGDHLALMVGEAELARRVRRENRETPLSSFLSDYLETLDLQQQGVRRLLATMAGHPSRLKQAGSWMAEKLGRFKFNGSLLHYTDLSRVLELEALLLLATARKSMWSTLTAAKLEEGDFQTAKTATVEQLNLLNEHLKSARRRVIE
ncbi:hypothetical protein NG895_23595 [Aeoliella sp. ICT_H6.2]|uniref:DUF892 family protein n=1 Tax=Aeoliella straminimaris TaxID=2954799 RepID=A0A9X2FDC4_9BACT|nr:hypothetical protein [Aeoliella straminimaris]MCO6046895.1 hypothetical protein [Aeoliella straminimaris]